VSNCEELWLQIFGPVLVALPFRTAKEAVSLANNTNYGLGGSVWTENVSLALEVALLIKAGSVWVSGSTQNKQVVPCSPLIFSSNVFSIVWCNYKVRYLFFTSY